MPEPIDMIVPMLQRMQTDIADIKRDTTRISDRMTAVEQRMGGLEERFEAIGTYITFTTGLHAQNRADVETHAEEIIEIKKRLDALESAPGS